MASLKLTVPEGTPLVNGKQITFRTPYDSSRLNGIEIDNYIFEVLDSNNRPPSSRLFSPGSMITVVLDMDHMIAYIPSDGIRLGKDADATDTAALAATLDEIGVNSENLSVSDNVKNMFGLSKGSIDDALECIGKYNQHWWSMQTVTESSVIYHEIKTPFAKNLVFGSIPIGGSITITYSDDINIDNFVVTLKNPNTFEISSSDSNVIPGNYVIVDSVIYFIDAGSYISVLEDESNSNASVICLSGTDPNRNKVYTITVKSEFIPPSIADEVTYTSSIDRNAYPDYDVIDGVLYKYIGVPFDKMIYDNEKDFKVGDLKISARIDNGENWLLCNGDTVTWKEYPELYSLLKENHATKNIIADDGSELTFGATICVDGVWYGVTPAICINSVANTYVNKVFSTSDPVNGTWTMINQILQCTCNDGNRGQYNIQDIQYENGVYFLKTYYNYSAGSLYERWYTTEPSGQWTQLDYSIDSDSLGGKIAYLNGLWTYAYKTQSMYYLIVKYATELTGEWTTVNPYIDLSNNGSVKGITYADGKWVITCSHWHTSDNVYTSSVYITEDITNASSKDKWTRYDIKSEDNYQYIRATDSIKFINNIWVFIGFSGNLIITTDLSKAWTNISSGQSYIQDVLYIGDTWLVYGCYNSVGNIFGNSNSNIMISTTEDINSGLQTKYNVDANFKYTIMSSDYNYSDGCFVCVCSSGIASNYLFHLPTITQDSSYVYIKAKG